MSSSTKQRSTIRLHKKEKKHNNHSRFVPETKEIIVIKGSDENEVIKINLEDIRSRLDRLREHSHMQLRSLTGTNADDYRALVHYTQLLYDTEAYKIYYDEVKSRFSDLSSIEPGTIGAYFGGCLTPSNFNESPGCSLICAGSMPPPKSDLPKENEFSSENRPSIPPNFFCQYTVLWAIYDNDKGSLYFTPLHVTQKEDVIVFIDPLTLPGKTFTGLTDEEKVSLSHYGAKRVNLVQYASDSKTYNELLGGFTELENIPSRVEEIVNEGYQTTGSSNNLLIVVLILLVLVAVFIGWKILNNRKLSTY